jgi:hypothetical protein
MCPSSHHRHLLTNSEPQWLRVKDNSALTTLPCPFAPGGSNVLYGPSIAASQDCHVHRDPVTCTWSLWPSFLQEQKIEASWG